MYRDEIIAEVWRNRDAYAKKHNHNLDEIVTDLCRRQQASRSKIIDHRDSNDMNVRRKEKKRH